MKLMKWCVLLLSAVCCFGQEHTRGLNVRVLGSSASTGNDASETTAAYTPRLNTELLALVINTKASAPDQPAIVANDLVWTELFDTNYLTTHRLTVWYAKCGSGAIRGTFNANTGATAQTGWAIAVWEIEGSRITGVNGVDALRQNVNANVSAGTSITATFAALGTRTTGIGVLGANLNSANMSAESGWTKLTDINFNTPATELTMVYQLKNADTTCNIQNAASFSGCIVGVEFVQDAVYP